MHLFHGCLCECKQQTYNCPNNYLANTYNIQYMYRIIFRPTMLNETCSSLEYKVVVTAQNIRYPLSKLLCLFPSRKRQITNSNCTTSHVTLLFHQRSVITQHDVEIYDLLLRLHQVMGIKYGTSSNYLLYPTLRCISTKHC